jgi:hypothetical protein
MLGRDPASQRQQLFEQTLQGARPRCRYPHPDPRRLFIGAADVEGQHVEAPTVLHHSIED